MKNEEKKEEIPTKPLKTGFFKKIWYSIVKIEKYPEMAAQGVGKSIAYLSKLIAILAIILCLGMIGQTYKVVRNGINYIQNQFPEFSYKEGELNIEEEDKITIDKENSIAGKIIIDTKTQDEQKINEYINSISEEGEGIVVLKDKILMKNMAVAGTITYNYKETLEPMGINEFNKQDVINYANSTQIISLYISVFLTIFIYAFVMYFLTTISNVILLSAFGYITSVLAKIKMRYVAIFNMSVYALTLSIILNMIYIGINIFIKFNIEYFQVMYTAVAAIYLVAAILILKSEFIKKQFELMKIAEAEAIIKKEKEEQEQKEEKEKEERRKKDKEESDKKKKKEKKKSENEEQGNEPEGSNA